MGEASASFGDSQNYSEETSGSAPSTTTTATHNTNPNRKRSNNNNNNNRRSNKDAKDERSSRKSGGSTKERTCKCDMCDFTTAYSFSLTRHKEKVHKQLGPASQEGTNSSSSSVVSKPKSVKREGKSKSSAGDPSTDPVVLPSMFSSSRSDFLELGSFSDPSNSQENAQWSIPNTPTSNPSVKFETAEGIPINIFETSYNAAVNPTDSDFITFRKAEESNNSNVVETIMNGYTGATQDTLSRSLPSTSSVASSSDSDARGVIANDNNKSRGVSQVSKKSQPPQSSSSFANKNSMSSSSKKSKSKKLSQQQQSQGRGDVKSGSNNKKRNDSSRASQSSVTSDTSVDSKTEGVKKKRSQKKYEKILITSTATKCPLCDFSSKYPSNTGRHFSGIHKEEYNQVLQGKLELAGIKIREDRPTKVEQPREPKKHARSKSMVELKIPHVTAPLRQDYDHPPMLVAQNSGAPTAAQELAQFVQQENLEMYASGEPENLDLTMSTEPIASFIESLLSSGSIESTEWTLPAQVEPQYAQPTAAFAPDMINSYGQPTVNGVNVIPPVPQQVTNMTVNYMHPYSEIPQIQAMSHAPLQQMPLIDVPVANFTSIVKIEQKPVVSMAEGPKSVSKQVKRKSSTERPELSSKSNSKATSDEEREAKRQRTLEKKREQRRQKKLQKDAERMASTQGVGMPPTESHPVPAPVVSQPDWSSQYIPMPEPQQPFGPPPVPPQQNHFELLKNESNHVQQQQHFAPLQMHPLDPHSMAISQPSMSPAPPLLSMPVPAPMNSSQSLDAVYFDPSLQPLPPLAQEYHSPPPHLNPHHQIPEYRQAQMSIPHPNEYLPPPKHPHEASGFSSPPPMQHSLPPYENLTTLVNVPPQLVEYQPQPAPPQLLPQNNSLQLVTGGGGGGSPDRGTPSAASKNFRRSKSEQTPEEQAEARKIHLAKRREQYRNQQARKSKAAEGGLSAEEEEKRKKRLAKRREHAAARRKLKSQSSAVAEDVGNNAVLSVPSSESSSVSFASPSSTATTASLDKPSTAPCNNLTCEGSKQQLPSGKNDGAKIIAPNAAAAASFPSQTQPPLNVTNTGESTPKSKKKMKGGGNPAMGPGAKAGLSSPQNTFSPSSRTSSLLSESPKSSSAGKQPNLSQEEIEERRKEKKREQNRRYLQKKRAQVKASRLAEKPVEELPVNSAMNASYTVPTDKQAKNELSGAEVQQSNKNSSFLEVQPAPVGEFHEPQSTAATNITITTNTTTNTTTTSSSTTFSDINYSDENHIAPPLHTLQPVPMETMKITDFEEKYLCQLPIQETQAMEAFGFLHQPSLAGLSSPYNWGPSLAESTAVGPSSFVSHHLSPSLSYGNEGTDHKIGLTPSKTQQEENTRTIIGNNPEELLERKKMVQAEKRREQQRAKAQQRRQSAAEAKKGSTTKSEAKSSNPPGSSSSRSKVLAFPSRLVTSLTPEQQQQILSLSFPSTTTTTQQSSKAKGKKGGGDGKGKLSRKELALVKKQTPSTETKRSGKGGKQSNKKSKGGGSALSETTVEPKVEFLDVNKPSEIQHCSFQDCDFKTDSKYKLNVHTTFHDALQNMSPVLRSMLEATGNVELLMKLQPERDAFTGCLTAKTADDDVAMNIVDVVPTGAPG